MKRKVKNKINTMKKPNRTNKITSKEFKCILSKNATEHEIQVACVEWFDTVYRKYSNCLFAVPNGYSVSSCGAGIKNNNKRNGISKATMKSEGMRKGVADLILFAHGNVYPIEMKKEGGRLSLDQKQVHQDWSTLARIETKVCWSVDEFIEYVDGIMKNG